LSGKSLRITENTTENWRRGVLGSETYLAISLSIIFFTLQLM